jgi:hypothetical protein
VIKSLQFTIHSSQFTLISHLSFSNVATKCKLLTEDSLKIATPKGGA